MLNKIKKNQKFFILLTTLILIILLLLFIIFKSIFSYNNIQNFLNDFLGVKIQFNLPKTYFDSKLNLNSEMKNLYVFNKDKSKQFIYIENLKISIKPFGFLIKKANIKNISATKIIINLQRDDKGDIDLYKEINTNNLLNKKINFNLTRLILKIPEIEINLKDYELNTVSKFKFYNTNLNISKKEKKFYFYQKGKITTTYNNKTTQSDILFNIQTIYPFKKIEPDKTNIEIKLNNTDISIFSALFKKYISNDIKYINGKINFSTNTIKKENLDLQKLSCIISDFQIKLKDNKMIIPYKDNINFEALFDFSKDKISFNKIKLFSNELNITSDGTIEELSSKNPKVNIKTNISNTQLNNFLYFIPDNSIPYRKKGIPSLKKSNFHANLNGNINVSVFPLNITGNLKALNVFIPGYPKPYIQNDVNAIFMKDKVRVYTRVYTPQNEYVVVDGVSNLDNSTYGKYYITSTKNVDLNFAKLYLVPIQQIIGFNIGPVPIMELGGYGHIDLNTQGTIFDAQAFGEFDAHNASAKIEGLNAKIENGKCKLIFDNQNVIFKEIKGKLKQADFTLSGTGNIKGEVELKAKIQNATTQQLLDIFNNSEVTKPYKILTSEIAAVSGKSNAEVDLKGIIEDFENKNLLNKLAISGKIDFINNKIIFNNKFQLNRLTGFLDFGQKQKTNLIFYIGNSKFNLNADIKENLEKLNKPFEIDANLLSDKISFRDILKQIENIIPKCNLKDFNSIEFYSKLNLKLNGKISLANLDLSNLNTNGYLVALNSEKNKNIYFSSGIIKFQNNKMIFDNFNAKFNSGSVKINGIIKDFLNTKPSGDIKINLNNINISNLDNIVYNIKLKNSTLKSGEIVYKNHNLIFNSMNFDYNSMPLFFNATIKDIFNKKIINMNFATILNELTSDYIINPYLNYPIKIKGEMPIKASFSGNKENYAINFNTTLPENSDISFSGANLGDTQHKRQIAGNIEVNKNIAKVNNLYLSRYILNQNNKTNQLIALKSSGQIIQNNNDINYKNFKISTNSPINVRILNLIFKKSLLKKGNFECNVELNGNIKSPKIIGKILLEDLDIPLYDAQIKEMNFNITDKIINGEILAKNKLNDIKIISKIKNTLNAPYIIEKLDVTSNMLNISDILSSLISTPNNKSDITIPSESIFKPEDFIIKNGTFDFKNVKYDTIKAQDLNGHFDYNNKIFNLKNINFDIVKGKISANGKYNIVSTKLDLNAKMFDCDSNELSKEFLKLQNQIYGKMNGSVKLSAKNLNTPEGIKNTKLDIDFSVNDGKMPKLGSLEYILRAGNILKNGLLGLSLNNLIQILNPYKTGYFDNITGNLSINNGEINNLEIFSKGKNLSLYLTGTYNILENFANIEIYGKLSQNIQNALGTLGNASIKQVISSFNKKDEQKTDVNFSKVPSIEAQNSKSVLFRAKVLGDINKENYVKSFNWE